MVIELVSKEDIVPGRRFNDNKKSYWAHTTEKHAPTTKEKGKR